MNDSFSASASWWPSLHHALGAFVLWRETSVGGAYVPTLMVVFLLCIALTWLIDVGIARTGAYRYIWHPPLFRVSLFVCFFSAVSLALFG